MSEQIKQIAARIKELREINGVSLESLAKELEVSNETYSDYESGNIDIPVGFLYKFANKFSIDLAAILTGDVPKLHSYSIVRKGKGINIERRKEYQYQHLAYNFIHKKAEPFLVTVEPEDENSPIHYNSHPGQEFNYVLEGKLKIEINGYELILNEGDSLFFDSNISHGMKALENKPCKFLAIVL
ncbi:MAG: transcriptional regulator, family [Clostridiales bacterium]|jgi:quercetin dioxygenase-like cupin family protein/DNA-binding XRE family transcriptional regulator|nr:transcriptional regulator, family [Clostridiales bacterium]